MLTYKIKHKETSELILKQIKAFGTNYTSRELTKFIYGASEKQGDYLKKRIRGANLSEEKKQELIGELRRVFQGIKERYNATNPNVKAIETKQIPMPVQAVPVQTAPPKTGIEGTIRKIEKDNETGGKRTELKFLKPKLYNEDAKKYANRIEGQIRHFLMTH